MDQEIVIIVSNQEIADQVVRTLKALDDEGSIELYVTNVVTKTSERVERIADARHMHPSVSAALGATAGALIGFLGGPGGAAIGAAIGGYAGVAGDIAYTGLSSDFVHDVAKSLPEGGCAVIASVWEDWSVPLDNAMKPYGGVVFRQMTDDVIIAQIRAHVRMLEGEDEHLETEIAKAKGDAKTELLAQREVLHERQAAQRERLRARANRLEAEWNARIESIRAKNQAMSAEAKQRRELHLHKLSRFVDLQKKSFRELFGASRSAS